MIQPNLQQATDPIPVFREWFDAALALGGHFPDAVTLSTVDENGLPDSRMVLCKGFDERGFVVYTNFNSTKGRQILASRKAALCFWWNPLERQVRARGTVEIVTTEEAEAYFRSRPRGSQIGAWASEQSHPIAGRQELLDRVARFTREFDGREVPRPPHWSGFRIMPSEIEFWQEGEYRLNHRVRFTREEGGWKRELLSP